MRKHVVLWLVTVPFLSLTFNLVLPIQSFARPPAVPLNNSNDLIAEVNALRASNGLPAYNVNSILMQIAQAHSDYQASIGTTTHYSADGSRPFQRALAAGYPVAGDISRGGSFAENITSGQNRSAAQAVQEWQRDATHSNTMLSPDLQDVGAGIAVAGGVTYYTLDAGSSSGATVNFTPLASGTAGEPGSPATVETVKPVTTSTALEDGSLIHEVQAGEALWSIALAYGTTIDDLKRLNKLATNDIYEGQKLLIHRASPATGTPEQPTVTVTIGIPFSTPTKVVTSTPSSTATPNPTPPVNPQSSGMVVGIIIVGALLAAGIGTWLGTKKQS